MSKNCKGAAPCNRQIFQPGVGSPFLLVAATGGWLGHIHRIGGREGVFQSLFEGLVQTLLLFAFLMRLGFMRLGLMWLVAVMRLFRIHPISFRPKCV